MSFLSNNRFDLIMAFVTVCAVAALLGTNRANSPLQVKRMLDLLEVMLYLGVDSVRNAA